MRDSRLTEQRNPKSTKIDKLDVLGIVDLINNEDRLVAEAVSDEREAIARAIELVEMALRAGGRLIYVGAGTSGRLGVLDAAEMPPTFGIDPERSSVPDSPKSCCQMRLPKRVTYQRWLAVSR